MKNYKQYGATVKTVKLICEQCAHGYHLSEIDLDALKEAINDLKSIYETRKKPE